MHVDLDGGWGLFAASIELLIHLHGTISAVLESADHSAITSAQ
jgi:hypothetical protein